MPQVFAEEIKSIPMSPNLGESLERAGRFAREQGHRLVMLEHLLLALTEDPEASIILQSANVGLAQLGTDVSAYLGGLTEEMRSAGGGEPRPDGELLRVLHAAASAAQQSKRRQIDGAIVLAAIVGDGKSPAAGLLKSHGMTFEEAIRAIQRANTKARLKPIPKPSASSAAQAAPLPPEDPQPAARHREPQPPPEAAATLRTALTEAPAQAEDGDAAAAGRPAAQSADDILAAARARIQRRAAALNQPASVTPFPAGGANGPAKANGAHAAPPPREPEQLRPEEEESVSGAMRELLAATAAQHVPPSGMADAPRHVESQRPGELNGGGGGHSHAAPAAPFAALADPEAAPAASPRPAPAPPIQIVPVAPPGPLGQARPGRSGQPAPERVQPPLPWPEQPAAPAGRRLRHLAMPDV